VREKLQAHDIDLIICPSEDNVADLFTKALSRIKFESFCKALNLIPFDSL